MNAELGLVYASRDDDYAGGVNDRLVRSIRNVHRLAQEFGISLDLVVIDWNSPPGRGLADFALRRGLSGIRIIAVPESTATQFGASSERPFLEYPAKNVGLLHVKAEQALVLNPDIIVSKSLLQACVSRPSLDQSFLRADRTDFRWTGCGRKVILRRHIRHGKAQADPITVFPKLMSRRLGRTTPLSGEAIKDGFIVCPKGGIDEHFLLGMHTNAAGDFICTSRANWLAAGGFAQDQWQIGMGDALMVARLMALKLHQVIKPGDGLWHEDHVSDPTRGGTWSEEMWPAFLDELVSIQSARPAPIGEEDVPSINVVEHELA